MLYIIGIGLGTEKDLTIRSLEYLRKCEFIYLENYTSKLGFSENDLINLLGNGFNGKIILSDRILIESGYEILNNSKNYNCAVLVVIFSMLLSVNKCIHQLIRIFATA